MKVLMFGWEFPPHITGGLGTACFGLSQSLSTRVERIVFVLPRVKGEVFSTDVEVYSASDPRFVERTPTPAPAQGDMHAGDALLSVLTIDSLLSPYQNHDSYQTERQVWQRRSGAAAGAAAEHQGSGGVFELSGDYGSDLCDEVRRYARQASRAVLSDNFVVIHAHDWMTFLAGVEAKRLSGKPLVVHVHATEFDRCGEAIDQRIYDIERWGMEQADRIIAVSHRTKSMIVTRYGIPAEKIVVVHNGVVPMVPLAVPPKLPRHRVVSFLGRITMQKGPEYFLEAAYLVCQHLPDVHFVMAGTGDMVPRMIERMAALRLVDRFHFTGFLDQQKREALFAQTSVFVLSSVSEPFGITPIEAMQHGVPCVLAKQSGAAEVVSAAVKVDFWDVRRMADAIINILTNEPLALALTQGGHRDLAPLTWERAADRVAKIYKELG